eukprot:405153_1
MSQNIKKQTGLSHSYHRTPQDSTTFDAVELNALGGLKIPVSPPKIVEHKSISAVINKLPDLLKGYVVHSHQGEPIDSVIHLQYIDQCLKCINNEWKNNIVGNHSSSNISEILSAAILSKKIDENIVTELDAIYGDQIYDTLLKLAEKVKETEAIIKKQNMIYRPRKISATGKLYNNSRRKMPDHDSISNVTNPSKSYDPKQYVLGDRRHVKIDGKDDDNDFDEDDDANSTTDEDTSAKPSELRESTSRLKNKKCEGCRQHLDGTATLSYAIPKYRNSKKNLRFYFHDEHCVTLRKLKESIRKFVVCKGMDKDINDYGNAEYIHDLKQNYNLLITLRGRGIKKPCPIQSMDHQTDEKTDTPILDVTHSTETCDDDNCQHNITVSAAMHAYRLITEEKQNVHEFKNIPKIVRIADMTIYGESLAEFIMNALLTTQLDGLWEVLAYIMQRMPTIISLNLLNKKHWRKLLTVNNIDYLDRALTGVIRESTYTIATALYLSSKMKDAIETDVSRSDDFDRLAEKYVKIAMNITNKIKSDHLLSLLLETPTNIGQQTILQIAFMYNIYEYMDDSRIQMLMSRVWSEFNLLDPHDDTIFTGADITLAESWFKLLKTPAQFYYVPVGRFWIESIMYIIYVFIVTNVVYNPPFTTYGTDPHNHIYHNLTMSFAPIEWVMWIFNVGYFIAEISQMFLYRTGYLTDIGNVFDVLIVANWIIIATIRAYCIESNDMLSCSHKNNGLSVCIHMFVFCFQLVILWSRIALIFRINKTVGPFIGMIPGMLADIFNWMFVLSIFFVGFAFGAHFLIAGDIVADECNAEGSLSSFSLVFEYVFILLMGQSDWAWLNPNDCMSTGRSTLLKIVMWVFSVVGTILLLNLLIAMMSSTYELIREGRASQVNFVRSKQIYSLAYQYAIIPPPLNIFIWALSPIWYCTEWLVLVCTNKKYTINVTKFVPVSVNYSKQSGQDNYNASPNEKTTCCGGFCVFMKEKKRERLTTSKLVWCSKHYQRKAKYCRFCKCYMRETIPGTIGYYCNLFRKYQIDEAEQKMVAVLVASNGICPECFRPYKKKRHEGSNATNRLHRRQVVLEVLSFYIFMITLYFPLLVLFAIPAVLTELYRKLTNVHNVKLDPRRRYRNIDIIRDFDDEKELRDAINATNDEDNVYGQIQELNRKLGLLEKTISRRDISSKNILSRKSMPLDTISNQEEHKYESNEVENINSLQSFPMTHMTSNKTDDSMIRNKSSESETMEKYNREIEELENKLELMKQQRSLLKNKSKSVTFDDDT